MRVTKSVSQDSEMVLKEPNFLVPRYRSLDIREADVDWGRIAGLNGFEAPLSSLDDVEKLQGLDGECHYRIAESSYSKAAELLHEKGFRLIGSCDWCSSGGAEDWLGVNENAGRLVCVCLYRYELETEGACRGVSRVKGALAELNARKLRLPFLLRRDLSRPAPLIAVVGCDGAGKSSGAKRLAEELNRYVDSCFIYFGTGPGQVSLLRRPLVWLKKRVIRKRTDSHSRDSQPPESRLKRRRLKTLAMAAWGITVAWERKRKMKRALKAAAAGFVVVTDRYPQTQFPGIHDGPRLNEWIEGSGLMGWLARWEREKYEALASIDPDLVLMFDIELEVARDRRPNEKRQELERRIGVAKQLRFGRAKRVVVDASVPADEVVGRALKEILSILW